MAALVDEQDHFERMTGAVTMGVVVSVGREGGGLASVRAEGEAGAEAIVEALVTLETGGGGSEDTAEAEAMEGALVEESDRKTAVEGAIVGGGDEETAVTATGAQSIPASRLNE